MPNQKIPGEYLSVVSRMPAQLDPTLMKEPRALQGVPRTEAGKGKRIGRKAVPSLLPGSLKIGEPNIITTGMAGFGLEHGMF